MMKINARRCHRRHNIPDNQGRDIPLREFPRFPLRIPIARARNAAAAATIGSPCSSDEESGVKGRAKEEGLSNNIFHLIRSKISLVIDYVNFGDSELPRRRQVGGAHDSFPCAADELEDLGRGRLRTTAYRRVDSRVPLSFCLGHGLRLIPFFLFGSHAYCTVSHTTKPRTMKTAGTKKRRER